MSGLRAWLRRYTVAAVILVLFVGFGSATAVEDQFTVDIDPAGEVVAGQGTGFGDGTWYYYANTDWWAQWFYDGPYDETAGKVVEVTLTVSILNPTFAKQSSVQAALNWTTPQWVSDSDTPEPPLPKDIGDLDQEESLIERRTIVPKIELTQTITITTTYEISAFCPEWVSIDIRGENIRVEGVIQHECLSTQDPMPPLGVRDFGDAPEGALAYPSSGLMGRFPTCVSVGSATWIEHDTKSMYFGPRADTEPDGNGGVCPAFNPNAYNKDEGMMDGDAGLIDPRSYTIAGSAGSEQVYPLVFFGLESLGATCFSGIWGANIDIEVHNRSASDEAYVNLLVDWDQDGQWKGVVPCQLGEIPEHAVVNFPVPAGYNGPLSGLNPPSFTIGPYAGYVWTRFTITEKPVPEGKWTGDGVFADGETEDYLLYVRQAPSICEWNEGDSHTMHWAQLPNLWNTGLAVDMFTTGTDADSYEASLADDFRCTETSKLASVHFWGSFVDDLRPSRGVDSMTFQVNVYANQPADNLVDWDRPGELLWTAEVPRFDYDVSEVSSSVFQGWFDPKSGYFEEENHRRVYQFNICFDPEDVELFVQHRDTVYWLEIKKLWDENTNGYVFGWSTTRRPLQWNASAVWPHPTLGWLPMAYPEGHPYEGELLDLAFVTTGQSLRSLDFGDAPDPTYPTLAENDGAYHVIDKDVYLGKGVDAEVDGQPSAVGTGDDADGTDDEDGVVFISALVPGDVATVEVVASIQGALNAWIDFNGDGDWSDAGEQIAIDTTLSGGINYLTFDVPSKAVAGPTMSRWRFSRSRGLSYDGPAPDGEVEDHVVTIEEGLFSGFFPLAQVTWSQPPIEWDPSLGTPVYCGWNQPAYASKSSTSPSVAWKVVADNFRSLPGTPVTSVHWWGSYTAWEGPRRPDVAPDSWRIGFWSNVPAGSAKAFDRPGKLLWLVKADAGRVQETSAGLD